jgi:hypothetical protein
LHLILREDALEDARAALRYARLLFFCPKIKKRGLPMEDGLPKLKQQETAKKVLAQSERSNGPG